MFKYLARLLFVTILISLFSANPIFVRADNQKNETHEQRLARIRKELQPFVVHFLVLTPKREGRDADGYASGVVIFKEEHKEKDIFGNVIKYNTYYVLVTPHMVSDEEWDLKEYKKHNVRIFALGKNDKKAQAQIVAWEWNDASMIVQVDISENELEHFGFQVANIAKKMPVSLYDSKYSGENVPTVYLSGYPDNVPITNSGYIRQYFLEYKFNKYSQLVKMAFVDVEGFNGPGQSGAGVFNEDKELVGIVFGSPRAIGPNLSVIVPIDVIVERFLKQLLEFKDLNLPSFELEERIKNKPISISKPENKNNSKN